MFLDDGGEICQEDEKENPEFERRKYVFFVFAVDTCDIVSEELIH